MDEIAAGGQEGVGIGACQRDSSIQPLVFAALDGAAVDDGTGILGEAVDTIRSCREKTEPVVAGDLLCDLQGELLGTDGVELWRSDGTEACTEMVYDINPGSDDSYPGNLRVVGDRLIFMATEPTHGSELWALDIPLSRFGFEDCDPIQPHYVN